MGRQMLERKKPKKHKNNMIPGAGTIDENIK